MAASKPRSRFYSITVLLILAIFLLILPVVLLSCAINYRFMRAGVQQVERSRTQVLEGYCGQLDRELSLAENAMNDWTFYNGTTVYLTDRSSSEFYYAANTLNTEVQKAALYYEYISGFFVYVPNSDYLYTYMADSAAPDQKDALRSALAACAGDLQADPGWQELSVDGVNYLVQGFYSGGIYGGSFLRIGRLAALLQPDDAQSLAVGTADDLAEARAALGRHSTLVWAQSARSGLVVYEVLDEGQTLSSLPFLQRYFALVTAAMLLCIPLLILVLQRLIIAPLRRLTQAMQKLESGAWDTRITERREAAEFRQIAAAFNHMAQELQNLKIAVYEEQLETQRTKLQNLSYQLRPHFMINSLNMAYNMVANKDYAAASRLMRFSASYMRYLLHLEDDFVPLQDELRHLEDYLGIQLLRYEGQFDYRFDIDPFVADCTIPSMILQNFVENSIKYSLSPGRFTHITLKAAYTEQDGEPSVALTVRDNGGGYPQWLLDALHAEDMQAMRDRVGLRNTMQRIKMLFAGRARCRFYNDGGAVSEFVFPLDEEEAEG